MSGFGLFVIVLAVIACVWMVWAYGWLGVYMVGFIAAACLVERWSAALGVHPVLAVFGFVVIGWYVGHASFRAEQDVGSENNATRII